MHFQREGGLLEVVVELIFLYNSRGRSLPWCKQRGLGVYYMLWERRLVGVGHRVVSRGLPLGSQLVGRPSIALSICLRRLLQPSISFDSPIFS